MVSYGPYRANAEDLVEEAYVHALQAAGRLRLDNNVKGWLFTILRNIWLNQLRQRRNGPMFIELAGEDDMGHLSSGPSKNSLDIYIAMIEHERVRKAITALPPECLEVIHLREYEDLSYREIATILDCPMGTVMSRLSRARKKLKHMITAEKQLIQRGVHAALPWKQYEFDSSRVSLDPSVHSVGFPIRSVRREIQAFVQIDSRNSPRVQR